MTTRSRKKNVTTEPTDILLTEEAVAVAEEQAMVVSDAPAPLLPGDIFFTTIEEEHQIIAGLAQVASKAAQMLVLHLIHVRDTRLWEQHRNDDGEAHGTWSNYLNWACKEFNIHRATLYRGMAGADRMLSLGVQPDALFKLAPATVDNVSKLLTVTDPTTKQVSWSDEVVARATAQGVDPIEIATEIAQLPRSEVLKAAREVSKAPPAFYLQAAMGEDKVELVVLRGEERVLRLVAFDLEDTVDLSDALDYLARKLNVTFIPRDDA